MGGGGVCEVVRADTADLDAFVERGGRHVGSLSAIFDAVAAARAGVVGAMGAADVPPAGVAKPLGGHDPLAELIAEATLANAFVERIGWALGSTTTGAVGGLVPVEVVDAALAVAGLDALGPDRSQAGDQALVEDLAIRQRLEEIVATGAGVPRHLQGQMVGVALEDHLAGLDDAEAERAAAMLVDYGIDLQASLDPEHDDGPGRAVAATLLVTQGLLLWPGDRGDLVEDLAERWVPTPSGGRDRALSLVIDALDLEGSNEDLNVPGLWWGPWQRANQPFVRHAVLAELIGATQGRDGRISAGGQRLVDEVLDRRPGVVERADGTWHDLVPDDRYHTTPGGDGVRAWPSEGLRITLARALAAPNYGLDDAGYDAALELDALDEDLVDGTSSGAELEAAWLRREILVERFIDDPDEAMLLVAAMGAGSSAAEALRLVRFGSDASGTDARVRRLRVVYATTAWGDPVPIAELDPDVWPVEVARSLAIELGALQGIQLASFAEGRPEPQMPLSDEQVELVTRYDGVARWFHHRFAWGWPGGAEAAVDHLQALDDDELGRILYDVPDGFGELLDELVRPENQIVWDLMAGAADNDTFLGPEGTFRSASGRTVLGDDPQALLVQLALLREVGPYHELLDGGPDGDGTINEGEVERWLEAARNDPSVPPALVDRVAVGAKHGLGRDTFGWDEIATIIGVAGLAAAAVVTITFSGGTAVPLWVQGGLVGLAALEGVAAWQAGDGVGAVLAGAGGVGDLVAAARLLRLADDLPPTGVVADIGRAMDEHPDLVALARRSDIDELTALADEAGDLTPAQFTGRYREILRQEHTRIVDDLLDEGFEPAQVALAMREAEIRPVLAPGRIGHALDGNVNGFGQGTGGHYARSQNVRVLSRSDPDANGVTTGTIQVRNRGNGTWEDKPLEQPHTFFPEHWTRRQTELEIDHAFANAQPTRGGRFWRGHASDGTPIEGRYRDIEDHSSGWVSAFPIFERRRRS